MVVIYFLTTSESHEHIRRFHTGVLFPGIGPIVPGNLRSHQKDLELELQTTPRKTQTSFCEAAIFFARISIISISISPAHQRRETNLWQHKRKMGEVEWWGSVGVLAIYSEVPNSVDFRPGTSGGSIRREVVCSLPVNSKQKKKKWRQRLHLPNPPSGTYSGVNAICSLVHLN